MDSVPESVGIGISFVGGGSVSWAFVLAIFLSNVPEGFAASAGMNKVGDSTSRILVL